MNPQEVLPNDMTFGFIGTGVITEAIINGMGKARCLPARLVVSRRGEAISRKLAARYPHVTVEDDNQKIADESDLLFLAVRPQVAEEVLSPLRFHPDQEVASVIAALPTVRIRHWCGPTRSLIRAVPLPAVADLRGVTLLSGPSRPLEALFQALGGVVVAGDQREFDAYTLPSTVMGLYFFLQEIIADRIVAEGADPSEVRRFLATLFRSLGESAEASAQSFDALRHAHSTPGGLNEQIVTEFRRRGGQLALEAALGSVLERISGGR